jgi:hypothetical protein
MSSVRPITRSEEIHATGEPLASFTAFFGMTWGIMTHLRMHSLQAKQSWFPTPQAKMMGTVLIGGGLLGGHYIGKRLFGNDELRRLAHQHQMDK